MLIAPQTLLLMAPLIVLAAASPGPDVIYIVSNALAGKWRRAFSAWSGIFTGTVFYALMTVLGLSAIFSVVPTLYYVIKWLGIGYLAYLGFIFLKSAMMAKKNERVLKSSDEIPSFKLFLKGFLVTLFNPKTALFFTAFLPQFVDQSAGQVPLQLLALCLFAMLIGQTIYMSYLVVFVNIGRKLHHQVKFASGSHLMRWADGLCGTLYLSLAAGLALWKRT